MSLTDQAILHSYLTRAELVGAWNTAVWEGRELTDGGVVRQQLAGGFFGVNNTVFAHQA